MLKKNKFNQKKHCVSFEEAKTVFLDDLARLISDPDHSENEDRFILLGFSNKPRLLIVCHHYLDGDGTIHIISARKAEKSECKIYKRFRNER